MSWIEETPPHEAQGPLADIYRRIAHPTSRSGSGGVGALQREPVQSHEC